MRRSSLGPCALTVVLCCFLVHCHSSSPGTEGAACETSSTCASGQTCSNGHCTAADGGSHQSDGGSTDGGVTDGGLLPDGGCAAPLCGGVCCGGGSSCVAGECHLDCGSAVRCGDTAETEACCTGDQVCFVGACTTPGPTCTTSDECTTGEYCEPSIGKCLPLVTGAACEYHPDGGFNPVTLWNYTPDDSYTQVMMAPVVIDVNGDGVPDVLANFFTKSSPTYSGPGVMRAISGDTGQVLWTTADTDADHIHPPAGIAAGILEAGGSVVAVTVSDAGPLIAFDARTGTRLWTSHDGSNNAVNCKANWGGPSLADLDGDGNVEVICGLKAFDKTGKLLWDHGLGGGADGPLTVVADLDGDGHPDVSDGAQAYDRTGTALAWSGSGYTGFPAVGDFTNAAGGIGTDGHPELVVVGASKIALVNAQTGAQLVAPTALPSWNGSKCIAGGGNPGTGGPPTIADFDGDGHPEVGVADLDCYTVFKLTGSPGSLAWTVLWSNKVQDHSSSVTGSSVFDFQGDGKAEVVYADEVALHVYNGADGTEVFNRPHCSGTTYEYPLIVDVNGNGRADIVISENTYTASGLGCAADATSGIHVFHDGLDNWVNTRAIWNQHTYHVTNVCDGTDRVCAGTGNTNVYGRIPAHEPDNWTFTNSSAASAKPLNNYRQNVQGEGMFNSPDLVMKDLSFDWALCPSSLTIHARVVNQGALGVLPGLKIAFYSATSPLTLIGVGQTTGRLLPGQSELVSITVPDWTYGLVSMVAVADDDGTGTGAVSECHEDNNTSEPLTVGCAVIN